MDYYVSKNRKTKMIFTSLPKEQYLSNKKKIDSAVKKILTSNSYILSNEVINFEKNFSKYCNCKYGVAVNSGTDALIISLMSLDIKRNDEVITTSHTALATISAILAVGAKPVLIDINLKDYCLDINKLEKSITKKTKAIVPVHIYGQSGDMFKLVNIAKKFKLKIVEDCAQSVGSMYKKKKLGSFGNLSTFSFYPTKNLGALGDAGIVLTNSKKLYTKLKQIRQYGWNKNRFANIYGINSRMDEIQAAVLNVKLKSLNNDNLKRIKIANIYNKKIKNKNIILPKVNKYSLHVYHLYVVLIKNRNKVLKYLKENNIYLSIHYKIPNHMQHGYKDLVKIPKTGLKNTEYVSNNSISLPMYPELKLSQINKIIKLLNSI